MPLHDLMFSGNRDIVELLIGEGAHIDAANGLGQTPLHIAAEAGNVGALDALLAANAKPNVKDVEGRTPLHCAVLSDKTQDRRELVTVLASAGADVDALTPAGWTALHLAVREGDADVVEVLVAKGANIDRRTSSGLTPLQLAVRRDHVDIVRLLGRHAAEQRP